MVLGARAARSTGLDLNDDRSLQRTSGSGSILAVRPVLTFERYRHRISVIIDESGLYRLLENNRSSRFNATLR